MVMAQQAILMVTAMRVSGTKTFAKASVHNAWLTAIFTTVNGEATRCTDMGSYSTLMVQSSRVSGVKAGRYSGRVHSDTPTALRARHTH